MVHAHTTINQAREAATHNRWPTALDLFQQADETDGLSAADLGLMGEAAWWVGRLGDAIAARERAYAAYLAEGDKPHAAGAALLVANDYSHRLENAMAAGWVRRAARLLADLPEGREHALLERASLSMSLARGNFADAIDRAERVIGIGRRLADADIEALGIHDKGRALVAAGDVDEGMALLEEAVVAAVSGELSPFPTAIVYCNATVACEDVADYRRAGEFAEAAKRWCARQDINGFPGMCRVRRAEITRLRGEWDEAEREARTACAELQEFSLDYAAEGHYQIGDIRMRLGDDAAAEDAFKEAHRLGREPQPGLALLRMLQGRSEDAESLIGESLADRMVTPLMRARLLPAAVEIYLSARKPALAEAAATELEQTAGTYGTEALRAAAALARGQVLLGNGSIPAAVESLRHAERLWKAIGAPYETARAKLHIAEALVTAGAADAAALEAEAARAAFERLRAPRDLALSMDVIARLSAPGRGEQGAVKVTRTLVFSDIVGSTDLLEAIGDEAWETLRSWHDKTVRALVREHDGEEVDHAGDGFFLAFESADRAFACALAIRKTMSDHRRQHGFAPSLRIGVHTAATTRTRVGYSGAAVHTAARICALAGGGEILASRRAIEAAGKAVRHGPFREVALKGVRQPVETAFVE